MSDVCSRKRAIRIAESKLFSVNTMLVLLRRYVTCEFERKGEDNKSGKGSFVSCARHQGDQITEDETGGPCSAYEIHIETLKKRDGFREPDFF
jgi:hypothetical protein